MLQAARASYVSPSSLKSFLQCRLRFYYEKVLKIRKGTSPALHVGSVVHEVIARYNKALLRSECFDLETISKQVREVSAGLEAEDTINWVSDEKKEQSLILSASMVEAFLEDNKTQELIKPMAVEVMLESNVGLAMPLLGIADLIRNDGVIVDYKTVASTPNLELEEKQHEFQLTCYDLLYEDAMHEPSNGLELIFLVKTKKPKVIHHRMQPSSPVQRKRFAHLVDLYAKGQEEGNWYPSPGMHCSWCSFRSECSTWDGGV